MKKSIVLDGREIIGCLCKKKKIGSRRYHYHCIKCTKPFLKFHYQKHMQGCIFGTPNSGEGNISKMLNFPTKENLLSSDKSSDPKVNKQAFSKTKTQNCSTGELASKKHDIMSNDGQKLRSERTTESETIKSLSKSITIGSIKILTFSFSQYLENPSL